jgi:hypothetical protein
LKTHSGEFIDLQLAIGLLKCGGRELERNVALLLANIVPWLIAPETWDAWKVLCAAFKDYFDLRGHEDGS